MTIKEQKRIWGIPLGRERVVVGVTEVEERIPSGVSGMTIKDRFAVDGASDIVTQTRVTRIRPDEPVREQRPSILKENGINRENGELVIRTGKIIQTVFRYTPE